MIVKLIGEKRALILGILLALNLALAGVYFLVIQPASQGARERLAAVGGQITSFQQRIQDVKKELDDYKANLPRYQALRGTGFFLPQDRFQLTRDLERIKSETENIAGFSFVVSEVQALDNAEAAEADMQLIVSRIRLEKVRALLDSDFYDLVTTVLEKFPAHIRLSRFTVKRVAGDVGEEVLKKVVDGEEVSLIDAEVDFDWITIVPKPETPQQNTGWAP